jgi:hypothetical protein
MSGLNRDKRVSELDAWQVNSMFVDPVAATGTAAKPPTAHVDPRAEVEAFMSGMCFFFSCEYCEVLTRYFVHCLT